MKLSQYTLLFLSIFLVFSGLADTKSEVLGAAINEKIRMDEYVGRAVDEALEKLIVYDGGGEVLIDKEEVVEEFFLSLESSLGILDDKQAKERLRQYFPVMVILDYDGFYIRYARELSGEQGIVIEYVWTEKQYYVREDELTACRFEEGGTILLIDKTGLITGEKGTIRRMDYRELAGEEYEAFQREEPGSFLLSDEAFLAEKRNTVTRLIEDRLQYYCTEHNKIAVRLGIGYEFYFPDLDASEENRAIPEIGLLAVFQGYPLKGTRGIPYERFVLSGAYLRKESDSMEESGAR